MCCPLAYYKTRLKAFKQYPGMVKAYIRCGNEYFKSHSDSKVAKQYSDVYEYFVANAFFHNYKDYVNAKSGNLFSDNPDYKKMIEDYFKFKLPDLN